jgi:PP-loop superfamily ATP-utilizing enzyme
MELEEKLENLKNYLKSLKKVAIASSGGVDSTFLLTLSHEVLNDNVIAITIDSEFQKREEIEFIKKFTQERKIKNFIIKIKILDDEEIVKNSEKRCYFCKKRIFSEILNFSHSLGFENILDGTNFDDLSDYRPGLKKLKKIEEGETFLKDLGLSLIRVRILGNFAKIEVLKEELEIVFKNSDKINQKLKEIGFEKVFVDLNGYNKEKNKNLVKSLKWI